MKRIAAPGIYLDSETGRFSYRPKNQRTDRRTERRLKSRTLAKAILEYDKLVNGPTGDNRITFAALAKLYTASGCPDRRGVGRPQTFTIAESARVAMLVDFFGSTPASRIRIRHCLEYRDWRVKQLTREFPGERTVDLDLVALSNVLNYGVLLGEVEFNGVARGRPRFQRSESVKGSRDCAPQNADELHALVEVLFNFRFAASESLGWQALFEALTGCRTSEVLLWRMDAKRGQPGSIEGRWLWLKRSKKGVNPWVVIHPDLAECITAHRAWHAETFPKSPWYFPGNRRNGMATLSNTALVHALRLASRETGQGRRTSHGLRSFYVTTRRGQGASDSQIAAEIGDKSGAAIIASTYGDVPENWKGGAVASFIPAEKEAAWKRWLPVNVVNLTAEA